MPTETAYKKLVSRANLGITPLCDQHTMDNHNQGQAIIPAIGQPNQALVAAFQQIPLGPVPFPGNNDMTSHLQQDEALFYKNSVAIIEQCIDQLSTPGLFIFINTTAMIF